MLNLRLSVKMWNVFCSIFLCVVSLNFVISEHCVTPFGRRGSCVPLYSCTALTLLIKKIPVTNYVVSFLKQSHCGFQGNIPNVCCDPVICCQPDKSAALVSKVRAEWSDEDSVPASRDQCGIDRDGDKIYGGEVAGINDYPWMALLGYKISKGVIQYRCGGSLINRRYVLTAGHCIGGYDKIKYGLLTSVRLGEHDRSAKPNANCKYTSCESRLQEITVASAYAHPDYKMTDMSRAYDIGIVRLAKRATYTYYVQPICLADNNKKLLTGVDAFVAGWGKTLEGSFSVVKRKLKMTIFDKDKCFRQFLRLGVSLNDKQICAGGILREDSCIGDSGGPLLIKSLEHKWQAAGIISFGNGCGKQGWPGVYTSVGGFLDWISATLVSTNHQ